MKLKLVLENRDRSATVVIDANYGDSGKGRTVDYLASRSSPNTLIVRCNGGAQAAHTVKAQGTRVVFSHFGSGTLLGMPTYLSRFFIVNPLLFIRELKKLPLISLKNINPTVYVDPECIVTTPYDMMLNQLREKCRGDARHGSCGVGINETRVRSSLQEDPLVAKDLIHTRILVEKLKWIRDDAIQKLGAFDNNFDTDDNRKLIRDDRIFDRFLEDCSGFANTVYFDRLINWPSDIIFEGAQGLGLDMDHGIFPYVTPSNTGLKNVLPLAEELGVNHLNILYVTRPYLTRHGVGPLEWEQVEFTPPDATNVHNIHQGGLRYGWLDIDAMDKRIITDLSYYLSYSKDDLSYEHGLVLTCVDQINWDNFYVVQTGVKKKVTSFPELYGILDAERIKYLSFGEDRNQMINNDSLKVLLKDN